MRLRFLGTGTSQGVPPIACDHPVCTSANPKDKRLRASILLQENGSNVVVDVGPDFREQMLRVGIKTLDAVLLTHEHRDHTAGLDELRGFNISMQKPIEIYCKREVEQYLHRAFDYIFDQQKHAGIADLDIHHIQEGIIHCGSWTFEAIEVMHHRLPILAFRKKNFAYVTDANFISASSMDKLRDLEVLVLNALRKEEHISHYNLEQALRVIEKLAPQKAYLTHLSYLMGFHDEVEKDLPENVFLAYDGLELEV